MSFAAKMWLSAVIFPTLLLVLLVVHMAWRAPVLGLIEQIEKATDNRLPGIAIQSPAPWDSGKRIALHPGQDRVPFPWHYKYFGSVVTLFLWREWVTVESVRAMEQMRGLEYLSLDASDSDITEDDLDVLERLTALENIHLVTPFPITDATMERIGQMKNLTNINIGNAAGITSDGFRHVSNLKELVFLYLSTPGRERNDRVESGVARRDIGEIPILPKLKMLEVDSPRILVDDSWLEWVGRQPALKSAELRNASGVTRNGLEEFLKQTRLERLGLCGVPASVHAAEVFDQYPRVKEIRISLMDDCEQCIQALSRLNEKQEISLEIGADVELSSLEALGDMRSGKGVEIRLLSERSEDEVVELSRKLTTSLEMVNGWVAHNGHLLSPDEQGQSEVETPADSPLWPSDLSEPE